MEVSTFLFRPTEPPCGAGGRQNALIEGAGNFPFLRAQSSACGSPRSLAASWTLSGGPSGLSPASGLKVRPFRHVRTETYRHDSSGHYHGRRRAFLTVTKKTKIALKRPNPPGERTARRQGGLKGGKARTEKLSPERRREIALICNLFRQGLGDPAHVI